MSKTSKIFSKSLDRIYTSCKISSRSLRLSYIPLPYLKTLIDISKENKVTDFESKEANLMQEKYFKLLDTIYTVCEEGAKKIGIDGVPFFYLKNIIKGCKKSMNNG